MHAALQYCITVLHWTHSSAWRGADAHSSYKGHAKFNMNTFRELNAHAMDMDTEASFEMVNSTTFDSASRELDTVDAVEVNSVQNDDSVVRKIVRKQKLEGNEYVASELAQIFRQRKAKNGRAKYWDLLSVDV
jgi:hypothetical protein